MNKRIVIAAGGTGGHLYPAQAFAREVAETWPEATVHFAGARLTHNAYFDRKAHDYIDIPSATFSYRNPLQTMRAMVPLLHGLGKSASFLRSFRPDCVVGFGSFAVVPILTAAMILRIPLILHEQNRLPGKVTRLFSRFAHTTAVHFAETVHDLSGNVAHVGLPRRRGIGEGEGREEAASYYGLDPTRTTLLIFGGSQGAVFFNQWIEKHLREETFPKELSLQVIHLTGKASDPAVLAGVYRAAGITAAVKPFEPAMARAWALADLFLGRSGASTIAEAMDYAVPGLLVPYPHAVDDHQYHNAHVFTQQARGGALIRQEAIDDLTLPQMLRTLTANRATYRENLRAYTGSHPTQTLLDLISGL